MKTRKLNFTLGLLISMVLLGVLAVAAPAHAQTTDASSGARIPAEQMLNADGTLNLTKGITGSLDLTGWNVAFDPHRGPLLSPAAPNGNVWSGVNYGVNGKIYAVAVSGNKVYVGGKFQGACLDSQCANYQPMKNIAKWDGASWSPLGSGLSDTVYALAATGDILWAGGDFLSICGDFGCLFNSTRVNRIAYWNGTAWSGMTHGFDGTVTSIAIGNSLYAGGEFTKACGDDQCSSGNVTVNHVARFTGNGWAPLGHGVDYHVNALGYNNGVLYVGGIFLWICSTDACGSGPRVNRIAKWDGANWTSFGNGLDSNVNALVLNGSDMYVGGNFTAVCGNSDCNSGNVASRHIAKWNGSQWVALGNGLTDDVYALAVNGSELYAGGAFLQACGNSTCNDANLTVNRVAKWSNNQWAPLGNGLSNTASALALQTGTVWAGGSFGDACGNAACSSGNVTVREVATFGPAACDAKPPAPVLSEPFEGQQVATQKVGLHWFAAPCATAYKVRVKQDSKQGTVVFKKKVSAPGTTTSALAKGHTYYWFVKACDSFGCRRSKVVSFTIKS